MLYWYEGVKKSYSAFIHEEMDRGKDCAYLSAWNKLLYRIGLWGIEQNIWDPWQREAVKQDWEKTRNDLERDINMRFLRKRINPQFIGKIR